MNEKLKKLKIEDFIWIIYIFIAIFAIVSNYYEKEYNLTNNAVYKNNYKSINITIFIVAFFIYLYFLYLNYQNVNSLNNPSKKEARDSQISLIASILFLIGGICYLFVEIDTYDPVEISII